MPRQLVVDAQNSFHGGLNTTADEAQMAPVDIRQAVNARLTEFGGVKKRLGTQRTHASAINASTIVRGGHSWDQPGSATIQIVACNGLLHTGTYAVPMTWTAKTGAISSSAYVSFATFFDGGSEVVYVADGGKLNKWDGTTFSLNLTGTPDVKTLEVYNQRLFAVGDPANGFRLYWSDLADGDTLGDVTAGGGLADIRTFGQSELIGLMALGQSLLIFHRDGISRFTGWSIDDIRIEEGVKGVSGDTGTIAPRSLVRVENVGYFLSDRGVYRVTESSVEPISTKIEEDLRDLDQSAWDRVSAVHNKAFREIHFFIPTKGIYVYNYRVDAWSGPWPLTDIHCMWMAKDGQDRPIVLFGGDDGFTRRMDASGVYLDDVLSDGSGGDSFTMIVQCHRMFFGQPIVEKSLRYIFLHGDLRGSTTAGISWLTNTMQGSKTLIPESSFAQWGSFTWGTDQWGLSGSEPFRIHASGRGTYTDITITDDGLSDSLYSRIEVHGFAMGARY